MLLAAPGISSANYEYTTNRVTYTVSYDGAGKITVTGSNGSSWTGQGQQSNGHLVAKLFQNAGSDFSGTVADLYRNGWPTIIGARR